MDRRHLILALTALGASGSAFAQTSPPTGEIGQPERDYMMKTAAAGAASLMSADIGLEKARGAKVKEFAKFEHDEQTTVADILKTINPGTEPKPDAKSVEMIEKLRAMKPGSPFDRAFVAGQIEGHQTLLAIQEEYLKSGKNREAMNVAKLVRGMVKEHLAILGDLRSAA